MARKKTPQQIERQVSRLYSLSDSNYNRAMSSGKGFEFAQGRSRKNSSLIRRAAESVRNKNGYSSTGKRTRNLDNIYQKKSGGMFSIQGDKLVSYRGKKANVTKGVVAG